MIVKAPKDNSVKGAITLATSKSISNRALIIQVLSNADIELEGLSHAEDTKILASLLRNKSLRKNAGMAGTAFRFLCAYLSTKSADYILTGAERMKERPIAPLVDALRALGAEISYLEKEGFAPLRINGKGIRGGKIEIAANVSSQFISALMMIAPCLKGDTSIALIGTILSRPYIEMTQKLMEHFGAEVQFEGNLIQIKASNYRKNSLSIEGDWSATAFYYSMVALAEDGELLLGKLYRESWQGDSVVSDIYYRLGVVSTQLEHELLLSKSNNCVDYFEYDFKDCPDLAQATVCTCVGLGIPGKFSGLASLKVKETNRIVALQEQLEKFGWLFLEDETGDYELTRNLAVTRTIGLRHIQTYNDHRMAMAFAPLTLIFGDLEVEDPEVVIKSNPDFWQHLNALGFQFTSK